MEFTRRWGVKRRFPGSPVRCSGVSCSGPGFASFNFHDSFERREPRGVLAILLAVGVGLIGYHLVTGAWIVDPFAGHLPPKAHITPIGWNLVLGRLAFGLGMA
jgi:hypothetical protein